MVRENKQGHLRSTAILIALTATLLAAVPAIAQAASAPTVTTGKASAVSFGTATLNGSLNPHAGATSYYFQYGPTSAYGLQTGIQYAGAGSAPVHVSIAISGLQPLTEYHFRLVAVNSAKLVAGADKSLQTASVPLSLAILTSPNPVIYGGAITVQGTLSGTNNGNRTVVLQANSFPFAAGFANVGNPELTNAVGGFSFPVLGLAVATQYRVVTTTNPVIVSPVTTESVAVRITATAGRSGPKHKALFHGTVSPAVDGMQVAIMHVVHGHTVFVAGTVLRHNSSTSSRFSRIAKVKRGEVYRVLVHVTNGPVSSTYGAPIVAK
jgi:hypothetical protein